MGRSLEQLKDHAKALRELAGMRPGCGCLLTGKAHVAWCIRCDERFDKAARRGGRHANNLALARNEVDHWETYLRGES